VEAASLQELEPIPGTNTLWAELRWAARAEGVIHLDDLLLRRVRLGLLLPEGGRPLLPAIRAICQSELGWDDARWETEEAAYLQLWQSCYGPPDPATIPDWRPELAAAEEARRERSAKYQRVRRLTWAAALGTLAAVLTWYYVKSQREESWRVSEKSPSSR